MVVETQCSYPALDQNLEYNKIEVVERRRT